MQIGVSDQAVIGRRGADGAVEVEPGLVYLRTAFVNVAFIGSERNWLLVDAGLPGYRDAIARVGEGRFGGPPRAILLTHGHFDHVGCLKALADRWDVRIYAHPGERPFLDGGRPYPKPDPRPGDGLMSLSSPLYPRGPIDVSNRLWDLPGDGSVPFLPDWRWIATPGHSPGHVSLWREATRSLVAGDAVVTTAQESMLAVLRQKPEMHGPPRYFTPDWDAAEASVRRLAELRPRTLVTGHGPALAGIEMARALDRLAGDFARIAPPDARAAGQGRPVRP